MLGECNYIGHCFIDEDDSLRSVIGAAGVPKRMRDSDIEKWKKVLSGPSLSRCEIEEK